MSLTVEQLQGIMTGTQEGRVEALRQILDYPLKQRDPEGSRFWFLRPGADEAEAEDTCPISVGFYAELDGLTNDDIKQFLTTDEQQREIYGHYTGRIIPNQPVMYLLLPESDRLGRVAMILPTDGRLRQRQIQTFSWSDEDLQARLNRLRQDTLARTNRMKDAALSVIPLVEWAFYKPITTAKELAQKLAEVSRRIERVIPDVYRAEPNDGYLRGLLRSFQKELLPTLKLEPENEKDYSFADIYAQTIAYGLFTARVFSYTIDERRRRDEADPARKETDFNREDAWELLPETNPFLRRLFRDVSKAVGEYDREAASDESPVIADELIDAIAEVVSILRAAKMDAILEDFRAKMNREDIVIRFYEDFLAAYKPQMRELRGVYYTPEPVVSYMVRSVDLLLMEKFDKPLGLADPEVMILDPACGTGTFLLWIFQLIYKRYTGQEKDENPTMQPVYDALKAQFGDMKWSDYVKDCLLPRIFGFELLMAPYAIAHLKLGLYLEETEYEFNSGKRLGVFLTNTLEEAIQKTESLFEEFIAEESNQAAAIKRSEPVVVVIGNPPYSANSANAGKWIVDQVRDNYYPRDEIKEHNPKLLLDDYVKFVRFSQWKISLTGYGILSFITNHGYLDNPTFRRMRLNLIQTFDKAYTIDLHGNAKRREKAPDGSKDENVFDIQQGVAISFFAKDKKQTSSELIVHHADLWGDRETKYNWLLENQIVDTAWKKIEPSLSSFCLFTQQDTELLPEYEQGWKISDAMPVNSTGIKTHRDHFAFEFELSTLRQRIEDFRNVSISNEEIVNNYKLVDTRDWKLAQRRQSLSANNKWEEFFTKCLYRPFDRRDYYHHKDIVELPKNEVMLHMISENNLGLMFMRQVAVQDDYSHFLVTQFIADNRAFYSNKGAMQLAPLYIYSEVDDSQKNRQKSTLSKDRTQNFSKEFIKAIQEKLGYVPIPESIFYYIYAVFYSPSYRTRYAEFLKIDFPRVPITSDNKLFQQLSSCGEALVELHLMKSPKLDNLITQYENKSNSVINSGYPKYVDGKVVINKKGDGFAGLPENVWNFYVGGYQVCQKWLKDRKGRTLSPEDITHYQRIVVALQETIRLMQQIDEAIPGWPIE